MARLDDGRVIFVPGTCPGDEITAQVTAERDRWVEGAVVSLDTPSPDRVRPECPYFGVCGGCQWQHVSYEAQMRAKHANVVESLRRIGRIADPAVAPVVPSPDTYGYRNRIELSAGPGPRGTAFGFVRADGQGIVPVDSCHLLPAKHRRLPRALTGALKFVSSRGALEIERVALRVSSRGEVSVSLWTPPGPFPRSAVARVIAESTGATTVSRVIARGPIERRDIAQVEVLAGAGAWTERLGGDSYLVSPPSFFQVNTKAAGALRAAALEFLDADGTSDVADLYAGVGTFTLPMARVSGTVRAVEGSRFALTDLRRNLERAGLDADVVPGDAAHALPQLGHLDAALIDPPRSGLSNAAMRALVDARIDRIVYVSCDPATLARDVRHLADAGYTPERFAPIDLFPQTYHVETVAVLTRR